VGESGGDWHIKRERQTLESRFYGKAGGAYQKQALGEVSGPTIPPPSLSALGDLHYATLALLVA